MIQNTIHNHISACRFRKNTSNLNSGEKTLKSITSTDNLLEVTITDPVVIIKSNR